MSTTPDDPFARRPEDGNDKQANQQPEGWGDATHFPPQDGPQYAQPQYAQPENAAPQGNQPQGGQPQYGQQAQYAQPQYGQGQYQQPYGAPGGPNLATQKNWMGITSLVLSILGLIFWFTAIGGIILGHLGRSAAKKGEADNAGLSLAGLIIGYIVVILGIVVFVALFAFAGWAATECDGSSAQAAWCTV